MGFDLQPSGYVRMLNSDRCVFCEEDDAAKLSTIEKPRDRCPKWQPYADAGGTTRPEIAYCDACGWDELDYRIQFHTEIAQYSGIPGLAIYECGHIEDVHAAGEPAHGIPVNRPIDLACACGAPLAHLHTYVDDDDFQRQTKQDFSDYEFPADPRDAVATETEPVDPTHDPDPTPAGGATGDAEEANADEADVRADGSGRPDDATLESSVALLRRQKRYDVAEWLEAVAGLDAGGGS